MVEALDAHELKQRDLAVAVGIAFHKPKQIKRWKFASPDKAGTRPKAKNALQAMLGFATQLMGGKLEPSGSAEERAMATGRVVAYEADDGQLYIGAND